jgi:hypothetical protein
MIFAVIFEMVFAMLVEMLVAALIVLAMGAITLLLELASFVVFSALVQARWLLLRAGCGR